MWFPFVCLSLNVLLQCQGHPPTASDAPGKSSLHVFPFLCGRNIIADNSVLQQGLVSGAAGLSCQHLWSLAPGKAGVVFRTLTGGLSFTRGITTCPPPSDTFLLTVVTSLGNCLPNTPSSELPTVSFQTRGPGCLWTQGSSTGPALELFVVQRAQDGKPGDLGSHSGLLGDLG